jgi:putative oxidoreductase
MKYLVLLGRILFSAIFIVKPIEHMCPRMMEEAMKMNVPFPSITVPLFGLLALIGGLSILLGFRAKIGAILLLIFLVPTTIYMHPFWNAQDSFAQMMHGYCFWKNLSMTGACLLIIYFGSGPLSLVKD